MNWYALCKVNTPKDVHYRFTEREHMSARDIASQKIHDEIISYLFDELCAKGYENVFVNLPILVPPIMRQIRSLVDG